MPNSPSPAAEELALLPELNPGPVIRADEEGGVLLVNAAARELFTTDICGKRWYDVFPVDRAFWKRVIAGEDQLQHEVRIRDRSFIFTYRRRPRTASVFIYGTDVTLLRAAEEALRQSEKMAMLGTLAAGVAHELNNPAAAAARGANQLRDAFAKLQDAFIQMSQLDFTAEHAASLLELVKQDRERSARAFHIDPLTRSDIESRIEGWLEEHDIDDAWELAPALVSLGYDTAELERVAAEWGGNGAAVIRWIARAEPVLALPREIEEATRRISDIAQALKTYSFLGEAPVRSINLTEGIDNTLLIMRNKLKDGVTVRREYAADVPPIDAFGSELNQVWTNLIDNSIDAMKGRGELNIRAQLAGDSVIVEIEDNGSGIPESARPHIFDPFFTTKEPGRGSGLGLSTSRNVVVKHGGSIEVASRPGSTRFTVRLPIRIARGPAQSVDAAAAT